MTETDLKLLAAVFDAARSLAGDVDDFADMLGPEDELAGELPHTDPLHEALHQFYVRASFRVP